MIELDFYLAWTICVYDTNHLSGGPPLSIGQTKRTISEHVFVVYPGFGLQEVSFPGLAER